MAGRLPGPVCGHSQIQRLNDLHADGLNSLGPSPKAKRYLSDLIGARTVEFPMQTLGPVAVQVTFTLKKSYSVAKHGKFTLTAERADIVKGNTSTLKIKIAHQGHFHGAVFHWFHEWKFEAKFEPQKFSDAFVDSKNANLSMKEKFAVAINDAIALSFSLSTGKIDVFHGLITGVDFIPFELRGKDLVALLEWKDNKGKFDLKDVFLPSAVQVSGHFADTSILPGDYALKVKIGPSPAGWQLIYDTCQAVLEMAAIAAPVVIPAALFIGGTIELFNLMQKAENAGKAQQILEAYAIAYVYCVFPPTVNGGKTNTYFGQNFALATDEPWKSAQTQAFQQAARDAQTIGGPQLAQLNQNSTYKYSALEAYRLVLIKPWLTEPGDPEMLAIEALHKKIRQQQLEKYK